MGARTRKLSMDDRTKLRIQTTQIVKRLEGHIFGDIKMEPSAVTAALGLLKKKVPDLQSTTHSGDPDKPIQHKLKIEFVRPGE